MRILIKFSDFLSTLLHPLFLLNLTVYIWPPEPWRGEHRREEKRREEESHTHKHTSYIHKVSHDGKLLPIAKYQNSQQPTTNNSVHCRLYFLYVCVYIAFPIAFWQTLQILVHCTPYININISTSKSTLLDTVNCCPTYLNVSVSVCHAVNYTSRGKDRERERERGNEGDC